MTLLHLLLALQDSRSTECDRREPTAVSASIWFGPGGECAGLAAQERVAARAEQTEAAIGSGDTDIRRHIAAVHGAGLHSTSVEAREPGLDDTRELFGAIERDNVPRLEDGHLNFDRCPVREARANDALPEPDIVQKAFVFE